MSFYFNFFLKKLYLLGRLKYVLCVFVWIGVRKEVSMGNDGCGNVIIMGIVLV